MRNVHSLAVNNVESTGSPPRYIAKYPEYVAIIAMNNLRDISSTTSVTWEGVYNTSKGEIEAKQLNLECQRIRLCTCDHARFSQFEAFYPGHLHCRIPLAYAWARSMIFLPFESLINILSNGVTNPIYFDM